MRTRARILIGVAVGTGLAVAGGYMAVRQAVIMKAQTQARQIIENNLPPEISRSADEEVIILSKAVFEIFRERDPSALWSLRLRPYVTNARLPEAIRFPDGAIETLVREGMCDNAVRMLKFVLAQKGYKATQWNMVADRGAHSALLADLPDGRKGFADPFYGFAAVKDGKLISAQEAQDLARAGEKPKDVLWALGPESRPKFYTALAELRMAAEGAPLLISAILPRSQGGEPVVIGNLDGSDLDVKDEAALLGMTPYWHYMGHKYNREWVREMTAPEDTRLEMTLLAPATDDVMIADPAPRVEGKTLRWDLKAGEKIRFRDGAARISFRRMNSYIGVDRILVEPLKNPADFSAGS